MNRRAKRNRKPNPKFWSSGDKTCNESGLGPMATSSPESHRENEFQEIDEAEIAFKQYYQRFKEVKKNEIDAFIESVDPKLLNHPFNFSIKFLDLVFEDLIKEGEGVIPKQNVHLQDTSEAEFKAPSVIPKRKGKKGVNELNSQLSTSNSVSQPSTSKSVHWDSRIKYDEHDMDVFKSPRQVKGKPADSSSDTFEPKTPTSSWKEISVGTPRSINKNMRVLRIPKPDETTVSLSGSPLLITPFINGAEITVRLPSDNGKVMTIARTANGTFPDKDDEVYSMLQPDDRKHLQELATYMLKNFAG